MNWNPFKRIADLERNVRTLTAKAADASRYLDQLEFRVQAQGKWLVTLESRSQNQGAEIDALQLENKVYLSRLNNLSLAYAEQENRLLSLQNQFLNRPFPQPVTITRADVEKEAKARLKRAAYSRKYYANKRAEAAKAAAAGGAK